MYRKKAGFRDVQNRKIFDRHEFLFKNDEELKIEFVYYNHDRKTLGKREIKDGIMVDSLIDMAANKTLALIDRGYSFQSSPHFSLPFSGGGTQSRNEALRA